MQENSCCSNAGSTSEQAELSFSKRSCCYLSQGAAPIQADRTSDVVIINVSKDLVKTPTIDNSYVNSAKFGRSEFRSYFQPEFPSNLKIYSFISSYLI